ncbi:MAG: chemotaxis protein CheW [Gammaproteobacteria bacterium]
MESVSLYLVFMLDQRRFGLPLQSVDKVVRRVAVTPLVKAPPSVAGVVNVQGAVIPVFNIRRRFGLPERGLVLEDRLIIVHAGRRPAALLVDRVLDLIECGPDDTVDSARILPHVEYIEGVVKRSDGLILIHDPGKFLSVDEERRLQNALDGGE